MIDRWQESDRLHADSVELPLQGGHAYDLRVEYFDGERDAGVRLAWQMPGALPPLEEAVQAARDADVVVFVGGLTGDVEGEEMQVDYPGFAGGDRTDIRLPATQQRLLEALRATGKPVVVVLTTGSALGVDWARAHAQALLVAWYPGQRGGNAVADVLFGDVNPAGRLPITFYKADQRMPAFDDYAMQGRTYRYFDGEALYPFGHGLSYTTFQYSDLRLDRASLKADGTLQASVRVSNTGQRAGDEVVQLYVRAQAGGAGQAVKDLRGVQRINLAPDEERELHFTLHPRSDLRRYDEASERYVVQPGRYEVQVGASSADIRQRASFEITAE